MQHEYTHVYFRYKKVLGTLGILGILGIFLKCFLLHTLTKAYEYWDTVLPLTTIDFRLDAKKLP